MVVSRPSRSSVFLALFLTLPLVGCGEDKAVTASTTSPSPDGNWQVVADVVEYGGPGTAGVQIEVSLGSIRQPRERALILLVNPNEAARRISKPTAVIWQNSQNVRIQYPKGSSVDFQAIKAYGINIMSEPKN